VCVCVYVCVCVCVCVCVYVCVCVSVPWSLGRWCRLEAPPAASSRRGIPIALDAGVCSQHRVLSLTACARSQPSPHPPALSLRLCLSSELSSLQQSVDVECPAAAATWCCCSVQHPAPARHPRNNCRDSSSLRALWLSSAALGSTMSGASVAVRVVLGNAHRPRRSAGSRLHHHDSKCCLFCLFFLMPSVVGVTL
jgi:hypothetical protein